VLELRLHVPAASADSILERLSRAPGLSHLIVMPLSGTPTAVIIAELDTAFADAVLAEIDAMGLSAEATLIDHRTIPIGEEAHGPGDNLIWADLIAQARVSSRAAPRYFALMAVAGIIAAMGILDANTVLIVGAMAVSPDLLPVVAACVGLAGRRPHLFARGFGTLAAGMLTAALAALIVTAILLAFGWTQHSAVPEKTFLGAIFSLDITSVIVAVTAGVAGMLAFETRGNAAVGVAISVTTIPAAAFIGVALAFGSTTEALHGLSILALNVACLLAGGTCMVLIQRVRAPGTFPSSEPDGRT